MSKGLQNPFHRKGFLKKSFVEILMNPSTQIVSHCITIGPTIFCALASKNLSTGFDWVWQWPMLIERFILAFGLPLKRSRIPVKFFKKTHLNVNYTPRSLAKPPALDRWPPPQLIPFHFLHEPFAPKQVSHFSHVYPRLKKEAL